MFRSRIPVKTLATLFAMFVVAALWLAFGGNDAFARGRHDSGITISVGSSHGGSMWSYNRRSMWSHDRRGRFSRRGRHSRRWRGHRSYRRHYGNRGSDLFSLGVGTLLGLAFSGASNGPRYSQQPHVVVPVQPKGRCQYGNWRDDRGLIFTGTACQRPDGSWQIFSYN